MTDTPTTYAIIAGDGTVLLVNASQTAASPTTTITPHSVPEVLGTEVANGNPLVIAGDAAAYVNRSGTITSGGVAQQLMPANAKRRGWWVRNLSGANLFVNETGATAVQGSPSWTIPPGTDFPNVPYAAAPSGAVSIIGPNTGQVFIAREY